MTECRKQRLFFWIVSLFSLLLGTPLISATIVASRKRDGQDRSDEEGPVNLPRRTHGFLRPLPDTSSKAQSVGIKTQFQTPTRLSEQVLELVGDSDFGRRLLEEELQLQAVQNARDQKASAGSQSKKQPSPLLYGSVLVLALGSFYMNGSLVVKLQEVMAGSASALMLAWLPTLVLRGSWVEVLSLGMLGLQPAMRNYLRNEFLPSMWKNLRAMVKTEVWRRIWLIVLSPLPKPLLVPNKEEFREIPRWIQKALGHFNDLVDKFTQTLIRKSVEQNVHGSMGVFYESISSSMLETSIMYEDSVNDPSAFEDVSDNDIEVEVEASEPTVDMYIQEEPELVCEGDSCSLDSPDD